MGQQIFRLDSARIKRDTKIGAFIAGVYFYTLVFVQPTFIQGADRTSVGIASDSYLTIRIEKSI